MLQARPLKQFDNAPSQHLQFNMVYIIRSKKSIRVPSRLSEVSPVLSVLETVPVSFRLIDNGFQSCSSNGRWSSLVFSRKIFERSRLHAADRQSCRFPAVSLCRPSIFPNFSLWLFQAVDGILSLALYPAQVAVFEAPSSNLPRTSL